MKIIDVNDHKKKFCTYCRYKTFRLPPKPHICSGCGKEYQAVVKVTAPKKVRGLDSWR